MATEIEHKYLVTNDSYRSMAVEKHHIRQGYLLRDPERVVRVRVIDQQGRITIKGISHGDARAEYEYEIPFDDAVKLLDLCVPPIIEKTRHIVPYEGMTWEVDEFHGHRQGLVLAEIELPKAGACYSTPPFVGENVTSDQRYYNVNL